MLERRPRYRQRLANITNKDIECCTYTYIEHQQSCTNRVVETSVFPLDQSRDRLVYLTNNIDTDSSLTIKNGSGVPILRFGIVFPTSTLVQTPTPDKAKDARRPRGCRRSQQFTRRRRACLSFNQLDQGARRWEGACPTVVRENHKWYTKEAGYKDALF